MIIEKLSKEEREILNFLLSQKRVDTKGVFLLLLPFLQSTKLSNIKRNSLISLIEKEIGYKFTYSYFTILYNKYICNIKDNKPTKKEEITTIQDNIQKTSITDQDKQNITTDKNKPNETIDIKNIPDKAKKLIPQTSLFEFIVEKGLFDENIDYYVYHDIKEINFGRFEEAKIDTDRLLHYQLEKFYLQNEYIILQRWDCSHKWTEDELLMKEREIVVKYLIRKYVTKWDVKRKFRKIYFSGLSFKKQLSKDSFLMQSYFIPLGEIFNAEILRDYVSTDSDTLYGDINYLDKIKPQEENYYKYIDI